MRTNLETQHKWINLVFENLEKTESNLLHSIENQSFNEDSLTRLQKELQMHYDAILNLHKSFSDDTFFTGYIE